MDTKISDALYSKNRIRYDVVCFRATPTADVGAQVRVLLVTKERPEVWDIDSTRLQFPNVVSYEFFTGIQWTPLIRA